MAEVTIWLKAREAYRTAFGGLQGALRNVQAWARTAWRAMVVGAAAATAAVVALGGAVAYAIRQAGKQEQAERRLKTAMELTGMVTAERLAQLKAYASALQQQTRYGDEEIMRTMAALRVMGVAEGAIEEMTVATIGLAATMSAAGEDAGSLEDASRLLVRAIESGGTALQKYGIDVADTGDPIEDLNGLLLILTRNLRLAQADVETLPGAWDQLKNAIGDAVQEIGAAIDKNLGVIDYIRSLKNVLTDLIESGDIRTFADELSKGLRNVWEDLRPIVEGLRDVGETVGALMAFRRGEARYAAENQLGLAGATAHRALPLLGAYRGIEKLRAGFGEAAQYYMGAGEYNTGGRYGRSGADLSALIDKIAARVGEEVAKNLQTK